MKIGNGFTVAVKGTSNHPAYLDLMNKLRAGGFNIARDNRTGDRMIKSALAIRVTADELGGEAAINILEQKFQYPTIIDIQPPPGRLQEKYKALSGVLLEVGYKFFYIEAS